LSQVGLLVSEMRTQKWEAILTSWHLFVTRVRRHDHRGTILTSRTSDQVLMHKQNYSWRTTL
jgi:hypothetical protein